MSPLVLLKQQRSSSDSVGKAKEKKKKRMSGKNDRKKNNLVHRHKSLGSESFPSEAQNEEYRIGTG